MMRGLLMMTLRGLMGSLSAPQTRPLTSSSSEIDDYVRGLLGPPFYEDDDDDSDEGDEDDGAAKHHRMGAAAVNQLPCETLTAERIEMLHEGRFRCPVFLAFGPTC